MKKSPKARAKAAKVAELDKLVGDYVKERADWKCEKCGKQYTPFQAPGLTSAHVKTKGRYGMIRFEPDNLMALCWMPCHKQFWHSDPHDAMEWFQWKWPGRIERIEVAASCAPKLDLDLLLTVWRREGERAQIRLDRE